MDIPQAGGRGSRRGKVVVDQDSTRIGFLCANNKVGELDCSISLGLGTCTTGLGAVTDEKNPQ